MAGLLAEPQTPGQEHVYQHKVGKGIKSPGDAAQYLYRAEDRGQVFLITIAVSDLAHKDSHRHILEG